MLRDFRDIAVFAGFALAIGALAFVTGIFIGNLGWQ